MHEAVGHDCHDCFKSTNFDNGDCPNNDNCQLWVANWRNFVIDVVYFGTELGYDKLTVNGVDYSGTSGPQGLIPKDVISWTSDDSVRKGGWKIFRVFPVRAGPSLSFV
mmetsp:Transcript_17689/g.41596  ORF Transcript_17689/g.41596 Transcript_17689/m.41596 type:complete len:108 (+) Transcript_17689:72-395(+)